MDPPIIAHLAQKVNICYANNMKSIEEIKAAVSKHAPQYHIKSVKLFGSYATGKATENSDIDLLVEYEQEPSIMSFYAFKDHIKNELKTPVDTLQFPLKEHLLFYPNFKVTKTIDIYG